MRFFDPNPLFVRVATGVVVQTLLTLAALSLGYAFAMREGSASALLAAFLLASVLLSGAALAGVVTAARRSSSKDEQIRALEAVLADVTAEATRERKALEAELEAVTRKSASSAAPLPGTAETRDRVTTKVESSGSWVRDPLSSGEFGTVTNRQL